MNRLQKKCVIATAGFHLLLLVILLVGPAFFNARQKPDDSQVLDVIPANLIDAQFNSGVKNAQPPAPAPVSIPQPQPPTPKPTPTFAQRIEKIFTPEPVKPSPDLIEKPEKSQPHKILPNLTPIVHSNVAKNSTADSQRAQALQNAIRNLKKNLSPSTTVDMPGNSTAAYANYASIVKSIYEEAWTPPDDAANDDANTKVSVTIASDGTVISARIIGASGDSGVDASIQHILDRVTFIAPFPSGTTDKERTYIINFNLKAKRMLE
ncbi:MAG TPA: TonB family protein [Verrucomicrobiae bacterium]|jgi:TonB family protein